MQGATMKILIGLAILIVWLLAGIAIARIIGFGHIPYDDE